MDPMDTPPPTPEPAESAYEKYMLRDAAAVRARLQQLIDHRATLTAVDDSGRASMVTALLGLDDRGLWVDVPPNDEVLRQLLASARITFEGRLDRVTLRFGCGPALLGQHGGRPALQLPVPAKLLHLQRREYVRREPTGGPLRCQVPMRDAKGATHIVPATIRDIGGGGLAVLVPQQAVDLCRGDVLPGCVIDLPDYGEIEVTLRVQHIGESVIQGRRVLQGGCEFVDLRPDVQRKLFRYIMQLDREELARRRERG